MTSPDRPKLSPEIAEENRERIETIEFDSERREAYDASVVIVTYGRPTEIIETTLTALEEAGGPTFEVVLVSNGASIDPSTEDLSFHTVYVELDDNYGVALARNLGAQLANGELLIFLDDDARPASDFVAEHLSAHAQFDIVGARGRIYPESSGFFSQFNSKYDMGDAAFAHPLDKEGNLSVARSQFISAGGFDENLYGHEGLDLTARLIDQHGANATIYYPDAIVYHDYAEGLVDLLNKKARHKHYRRLLEEQRPATFSVWKQYDRSFPCEDRSTAEKLTIHTVSRVTDVIASGLYRLRSYETPTR